MAETQREVGERLFKEICGAPAAASETEFLDITINHIFGEVWSRQDIANRDQRLLTIAVLTTLGEWSPCEIHMRMALESGDLSEEELQGAVIHLAHYAGWPASANVWGDLRALLEERSSEAGS